MSLELKADISRAGGFRMSVELTLPSSGITALFGPSGSGKTTLLRLIAGLDQEAGVFVNFDGEPWQTGNGFVPAANRQTGYVFQHLNLFPHLTVAGNLEYAERRRHRSGGLSASELIEMFQLAPLMEKPPAQLSGGEQQRVAIARALLSNPRLLLMDEPLGSIDTEARTRILPFLQRLHESLEIPVFYVSHSLDEVLYLADEVVTLDRGIVTGQQPVMDFAISREASHHRDAAAIVRCTVSGPADRFSLAQLSFEGETLHIASDNHTTGDQLRVRIPARDVSLTRARTDSSILNVIPTTISNIDDPGDGPTAVVTLDVGSQALLARITRKSLHDLSLRTGEKVYAQIKGVALMADHDR